MDEVELFHQEVSVGYAKVLRNSMYGRSTRSFDPETGKINFKKYDNLKWKSEIQSKEDNAILLIRFRNKYPNSNITILPATEENWYSDGIISIEFFNVEDEAAFIVQES